MLEEARKLIARAERANREDLDRDDDLSAALAWRLSVIGEAAARLSSTTREQHATIPWTRIVGMRNRLIHGYDAIDLEIVWQTVHVDLPPLVADLERILAPTTPPTDQ